MAATMKKWRRVRNPMHHTDYCSAINCSNSRKNTHNLSFFRFPKDEESILLGVKPLSSIQIQHVQTKLFTGQNRKMFFLQETSSSARKGSPEKKMADITAGDAVVPDFLEIKKEPPDIENQPNPEELLTARETFHDIKPIFLVKVEPESSHANSQHHGYACAPCTEEVSHTIKTEAFDTEGQIKMELPLLSRQHFCDVKPLFLSRAVSESEYSCAHSEQYENNIEGAEETFRIELNPDWLSDDEQNRHPTC